MGTPLAIFVLLVLLAPATPAGAKFTCGASACPDPTLVSATRAAVSEACSCGEATSRKAYAKCWKPVVRAAGLAKPCRQAVTRALVESTCGRPGTVLCRKTTKKGKEFCQVKAEAKCDDAYDTGVFPSCADTCDELEAIPFPSTKELSAADLGSLEPDPGDGTLRFTTAPAALADVHVGSILVAGVSPSTPVGLLRAVLAVERDGESLTLRTARAPIQLAYRKLNVRFVRSLTLPAPAAATSSAAVSGPVSVDAMRDFDFVLFDGDSDPLTTNDRVAIEGTVGGGVDFDFALGVDWGGIDELPEIIEECLLSYASVLVGGTPSCSMEELLPEAKIEFLVFPRVAATADVYGASIVGYEKEIDLLSQDLSLIVIGPLIFVPSVDVTALLEGGASGSFRTGIHGSAQFETSVKVSSRQTQPPQFKEPVLRQTDFGANETSITLHAHAKVGVGTRLNLLLYDVTGPYATARAYGAVDANILDAPCWDLRAGIEAELGVKVVLPSLFGIGEIFDIGDITLADWKSPTVNPLELDLASGDCEAPPEVSTLPPGSGPDEIRFATPTYTPWSRTYASPAWWSVTGPGNSTAFSELQRTIDGRYVRSGFGLQTITKLDEQGTIVWARDLVLAPSEPLDPLRVRSSRDAGLMVVSRAITASIVLTKLAQDGSVIEAHGYDVPLDVCNLFVTALASDGADGWYVTGQCSGGKSFLLHARGEDATFRVIDLPSSRLNLVEQIGGDAFLAGWVNDGLDALVALRMGPDGTVRWAKQYDGCAQAWDAIPSQAIVGPQGEVTMAGSGGAQHVGMLLRILPDGEVGFAAFPGFGFGAGSAFTLDSLVELPTTGYVAGGSFVKFTSEPEGVPSAALLGLDAAGSILWANRYTFGDTGTYETSGQTAVRLSDDGGVVATTLLRDSADPLSGKLWAFKPFAKDGSIAFQPGTARVDPLDVVDLPCAFTASAQSVAVEERPVGTRRVDVASTPVTLSIGQQTAE